jgi:hypothetical protein
MTSIVSTTCGMSHRSGTRRIEGESACGGSSLDSAFDRWLTHHLGRLYDPVVQEPLPADLLRELEERLK